VRVDDLHDVGNLRDAEQCGDARHDVLAECRRGREYMRIALCGRDDLRGVCRGQRVRVGGIRDGQHLGHAVDLRRFRGDGIRCVGEHQHVDRAGLHVARASDAARRGGIEFAVEVLGDDQYLAHFISPRRSCFDTSARTVICCSQSGTHARTRVAPER
jgi:hypothetical protein